MTETTGPLVSIVIPVYNQRLDFFKEAVHSALQQTYANLEVVVSNNYSTNDVPVWLETLNDSRLRVVRPAEFLPMVAHFQFAADQARGEWITYLCSDDWLYPDCIANLMAHLTNGPDTVVVAYGEIETVEHYSLSAVKFFNNRRKTGMRTGAESLNELLHARPFIAWMPGGTIKRSAYQQVRTILSGEITYAFDLALLFKLHEYGDVFYLDKPLGKFRFWTAKDGKVANDRFTEFISDIGKLCTLIEASPRLMGYLPQGKDAMQAWRKYQAQRWLMGLLVGYVGGDIEADKCRIGIREVAEHISPHSSFAPVLNWLIGRPQSLLLRPSLQVMHQVYSYMQSKIKKPL